MAGLLLTVRCVSSPADHSIKEKPRDRDGEKKREREKDREKEMEKRKHKLIMEMKRENGEVKIQQKGERSVNHNSPAFDL